MSDQVIGRAGEYEKLCRERSGNPRARNRKEVLSQLRGKANGSWKKIGKTANDLMQNGGIRSIRRFWIVNGFSCLAKPTAIRKFAKRADISFIYLDRFARPLKKPLSMSGNAMTTMKEVLATWRKKSTRSSKGLRIPWNVREIGAQSVWNEENATGKGIKVAVIDTGIVSTPPLIYALAKNSEEELNGLDDDGNGLIDDLFGYDFIANN
jgi:hypothetical protein